MYSPVENNVNNNFNLADLTTLNDEDGSANNLNKSENSIYSPATDVNNNSQLLVIPDTQSSPSNNLAVCSNVYINMVNNEITELKAGLATHRIQRNQIYDEKNDTMLSIKNVRNFFVPYFVSFF